MPEASFQTVQATYQGRVYSIQHPSTLGTGWFAHVLNGREYPPPPYLPNRPFVIVDVGANIGISTLYFALKYPAARIWALEPSSGSFACLRANTAVFPHVTALAVGLFSRDAEMTLHHGVSCVTDSVVPHHYSAPGTEERVTLRRASRLFAEILPVDYLSILKVDTEGCEVAILRDLADWLPRVDCLYYEYHSEADRLKLDSLLTPWFYLFHAHAPGVHRGTVGMIARRLEAEYPALHKVRIDAPE